MLWVVTPNSGGKGDLFEWGMETVTGILGLFKANNNNNKFIQYYHFVQVLPIEITIINS